MWKKLNKKVKSKAAGTVIKVWEERQLLNRLLLVKEARPELCVEEAIGEYEFTAVPRSLFDEAGNLHLGRDKAQLMSSLLVLTEAASSDVIVAQKYSVLLIDAMAEIQAISKTGSMLRFADFQQSFIRRNKASSRGYTKVCVLFYNYWDNSLKEHTRKK